MSLLFDSADLQITDDWIRTPAGTVRVRDVRRAWVARPQVARGGLMLTAALGTAVILAVASGAGLGDWLMANWVWILAAPAILLGLAAVGLFDPIAIYLEKRRHELWIATDTATMMIYRANSVEAHKAKRSIERAVERHWENSLE